MELDSIDKYIHMTKLAQGVEVMFAGQPCLKITEGLDSYVWAIYPVFAKLTYGANIFEDVPYCAENFDTMEEAIADGLAKLHSLGAFVGEVDLPEDTYAESGVSESVEDLDEGNVEKVTHKPINLYHKKGGFIGTTKYSPTKEHAIAAAERTYKLSPGSVIAKFDRPVKESVDDLDEGISEAYTPYGEPGTGDGRGGRSTTDPLRRHPANSSYMNKDYMIKFHQDQLKSIAASPYKRTKDVAKHNKALKNLGVEVSKQSLSEELLDSILQDCRAYATKHSTSLMEAHDLSLGLFESILAEAVENIDEVSSEKKQQYLDKAIPTHQKQFLGRSEVPATKQQLDKRRASIQKVSKELTGKTHYKESVEETLDEAKALSGDAYWKSKEDAASEEKAKANRASAGIKEPEKKGRGKPTLGATVDEMKDRMRENIAAGKRPHTGFDRNEKLRILRSGAMEHPEFAGTHVKAAGRPVGTTKAAAIEKKKAEPTAFSMWAGLGKK